MDNKLIKLTMKIPAEVRLEKSSSHRKLLKRRAHQHALCEVRKAADEQL